MAKAPRSGSSVFTDTQLLLFVLVIGALLFLLPEVAYAQAILPGTCTDNSATFDLTVPQPGDGLISIIVANVQSLLGSIAKTMYTSIVGAKGFIQVCTAAVSIYIGVYGILFLLGMVQITLFEFAIRMVKIGIIAMLLTPNASWTYFNTTVVTFFNQGTDAIINEVTNITAGQPFGVPTGSIWGNNGSPLVEGSPQDQVYPFYAVDDAIAMAFSPKMFITLEAIALAGPYGLPLVGLLLMGLGSFIRSLLSAMWVYFMSLILKTLLFGMAPIFIACILFSRTRHIFDGWLNQLVNASLQPLLLFTFFALFITLIEFCILNIIGGNAPPICYTEFAELKRGDVLGEYFWRFKTMQNGSWQLNPAGWSFGDDPPIPLLQILVFLILAELAGKFNSVVTQMAQDLAGTMTDLSMGAEGVQEMFSKAVGEGGGKSSGPALAGGAAAGVRGSPTGSFPTGGGGGGGRGGGGGGGIGGSGTAMS